MLGTNYYPIILTKGQQATIYFTNEQANNPYGAVQATGSFEFVGVSKDGIQFAPATNAPSEIPLLSSDGGSGTRSYGRYKIVLTADEMNADVITLVWKDTGNAGFIYGTIFIFTGTVGITAQNIWEYADRTLSESGGGLSLDDIIPEGTEVPGGTITVRQVLQLIAKRLKRNGHRI